MIHRLTAAALYRTCDPVSLGCQSSADVTQLDTIIGQERAVRAMTFGLDIQDSGFNIYVAGQPGTGRTTAIQRYLAEFAAKKPVPDDWCYVNNFHDPLKPNALRLPQGRAAEFEREMKRAVETAVTNLQAAFIADEYNKHKDNLINRAQMEKQKILARVTSQAQESGFAMQSTPMGMLTIPTKAGRPITEEEFLQLSEDEKKEIGKKQLQLKTALEDATRTAQNLDRELQEELEKLDKQVAEFTIKHIFDDLKGKYQDLAEIPEHIEQVRLDILTNVRDFIQSEESELPPPFGKGKARQSPVEKYAVNILVDHSNQGGAPVVLEMNPTYSNLVGRVEQEAIFGALVTNFTLIRPGCLHRANGGFLVLPVEDVLRNPMAWDTLKRALANKEIVIEDLSERYGFSTKSLRPEPIPLSVKVILIGRPDLYQLLLRYDEQFAELFKVKADFDTQMPYSQEHISEYLSFVCSLCESENLKHLEQGALARLLEHASRLADDQEKLSTRFGEISDVIRESNYYAEKDNAKLVRAEHIERTIEERFYRSSQVRDRLQEMIRRGQIKIDVTGEKTGQVNGLSVLGLGDITFGQPSRITASIALGKEGVINIEREAELSGPIHTKGVLILSGYLAEKYTQDKPLSLSARLVFEQNYGGVEGDSASSAELYALLSALAGQPINQGIAVTGSVNQKGEIQVIGGVNEKIEGFFDICQLKGLNGKQGVLIPAGNLPNLMLKRSVREAVEAGRFNIWAVDTIEEGIEVLTGSKAGERRPDGSFEPGSFNDLVDQKLKTMAETLAYFGKSIPTAGETG